MDQSFINRWDGGGFTFRGRVKTKYCCVREGVTASKKNNIGGMCFVNPTCSAIKAPMQKMCKNANKYQTLKFFSSHVSLTRHFTKFIFLEQLTAMPQINMQNMLLFFFYAVIMIRTLYFICIIFVKKNKIIYWLILTVNHQGSYFPLFFILIQWVKHFCTPANFVPI